MPSPDRHVVVDGSNIATEGRSLPSLVQLDEAVRAFQHDNPDASVTVIVDATFAHRIAQKERKAFDDAVDAGEIIVPPAGAIGRGDAFILQVAAKGDAEVLSNDSFQEFHGEHDWLFAEGRLIGAKPVEGIGWVFVDRVPVRGPESRRATRGSSRSTKKSTKRASKSRSSSDSGSASKSASKSRSRSTSKSTGNSSESKPKATSRSRSRSRSRKSSGDGIETKADGAKQDKSKKDDDGRSKSSKSSTTTRASRETTELNSPSEFLGFVTKHSIGDVVRGTVERFSSHGCYLQVAGAQCYLPVKAMGDPPPSKARDLVSTGDEVEIRVESLDAERRGINVELIAVIDSASPSAKRRGRGKQTQPSQQSTAVADGSAREANPTRSETNVASKSTKKPAKKTAKKASAKKAASAKKSTRKAPAKKTAKRSAKKSPARKSTKKAPAKKTAAKKATKKAPAKKTAKKAPAKKTAAKKSTKKSPAKKTAAKKSTKKAPAKKSTKRTPAKKGAKKAAASGMAKKSPAKATASKRAQKATAKKTAKRSSRR